MGCGGSNILKISTVMLYLTNEMLPVKLVEVGKKLLKWGEIWDLLSYLPLSYC